MAAVAQVKVDAAARTAADLSVVMAVLADAVTTILIHVSNVAGALHGVVVMMLLRSAALGRFGRAERCHHDKHGCRVRDHYPCGAHDRKSIPLVVPGGRPTAAPIPCFCQLPPGLLGRRSR